MGKNEEEGLLTQAFPTLISRHHSLNSFVPLHPFKVVLGRSPAPGTIQQADHALKFLKLSPSQTFLHFKFLLGTHHNVGKKKLTYRLLESLSFLCELGGMVFLQSQRRILSKVPTWIEPSASFRVGVLRSWEMIPVEI